MAHIDGIGRARAADFIYAWLFLLIMPRFVGATVDIFKFRAWASDKVYAGLVASFFHLVEYAIWEICSDYVWLAFFFVSDVTVAKR